MKKIDFNAKRIAQGYANRPWLHKKVMKQIEKDYNITHKFRNGLDVGCGAGLSTKALRLICDKVTGTDISSEMIEVCKEQYQADDSYNFYVAKAEETKLETEQYDIVTAAGMVNWVDKDSFLEKMNQVLRENGILVIYDFWITDQMVGNKEYTNWYQNEYLKRFPKPPRNEEVWTQDDLNEHFIMQKQIDYDMTYEFELGKFIDFMMIQSNVNVKIDQGYLTESEVRKWMDNSLSNIFKGTSKTLVFKGYNWYIIKLL